MILTLKFLKHISDYYIRHRNRYFIAEKKLPDNTIVYRDGKYFFSPNNLLIYKIWENHCTESHNRKEVRDFLDLAKGSDTLLDIGASSGMFSCIFNSEKSSAKIVSVEPDRASFAFLNESMSINAKNGNTWLAENAAISDKDGEVKFEDGAFGGTIGSSGSSRPSYTLESICKKHNITPGVIKIDIESYEYEVILSSIEFLQRHPFRLQIEIHNELLRQRGCDPDKIYSALRELGFRGVGHEGDISKSQLKKEVCHFHLVK